MNSKAVVIGYSGHAYVLLDMLMNNHIEILGYCEAKEKEQNPYRLRYLGHELDEQVIDILKANQCYLGVGDNKVREKIFQSLLRRGVAMPHLIYLDAVISPLAQIGSATVVMPGVVINSMVSIGNGVICNSACVIEHECIIEDYAHIAPGAVLTGNVKIGARSFVGANAVVKQGVTVGANVVIGAGAVVIKDVEDNSMIYGNPARKKVNE